MNYQSYDELYRQIDAAPYAKTNDKLTKSIAAQIIQSVKVKHPASNYPVPEHEKLSEEELTRLKGIFPWTTCAFKWASFSGVEEQQSVQAKLEKKITESHTVKVHVQLDSQHMDFISPEKKVEKIAIVDAVPEVAGPFENQVHKTAVYYYLLNPPLVKGEVTSTPIEKVEQKRAQGLYVPKECSPERYWVNGAWVGPFEGVYRPHATATIPQIEATINGAKSAKDRKLLYTRVMERIGPKYNDSAVPMHRVFKLDHLRPGGPPVPTTERYVGDLSFVMTCSKLWQQYLHFNNFARVRSAYEPFYYCLLPPGMAERAHVVSNIKWIMRQVGAAGVSADSGSSVWSNVKAFAALNVCISSQRSYVKMPEGAERGEFAPFSPVLRLEDMEGMASPTESKTGVIQFTPADPGSRLDAVDQRLRSLKAMKTNSYGVVSYYHPSLERAGWSLYPLNLRHGIVLSVWGNHKGAFTAAKMEALMSRFILGRMMFPYTHTSWPVLATEFVMDSLCIRNGRDVAEEERDQSLLGAITGKMVPLSEKEITSLLESVEAPMTEIRVDMGIVMPIPLPAPVVPVPDAAPEPAEDVPSYTAEGTGDDDDGEDLNALFLKPKLTPEQIAQQQALLQQFLAAKGGPQGAPAPTQSTPGGAGAPPVKETPTTTQSSGVQGGAPSGKSPSSSSTSSQPTGGGKKYVKKKK